MCGIVSFAEINLIELFTVFSTNLWTPEIRAIMIKIHLVLLLGKPSIFASLIM